MCFTCTQADTLQQWYTKSVSRTHECRHLAQRGTGHCRYEQLPNTFSEHLQRRIPCLDSDVHAGHQAAAGRHWASAPCRPRPAGSATACMRSGARAAPALHPPRAPPGVEAVHNVIFSAGVFIARIATYYDCIPHCMAPCLTPSLYPPAGCPERCHQLKRCSMLPGAFATVRRIPTRAISQAAS